MDRRAHTFGRSRLAVLRSSFLHGGKRDEVCPDQFGCTGRNTGVRRHCSKRCSRRRTVTVHRDHALRRPPGSSRCLYARGARLDEEVRLAVGVVAATECLSTTSRHWATWPRHRRSRPSANYRAAAPRSLPPQWQQSACQAVTGAPRFGHC